MGQVFDGLCRALKMTGPFYFMNTGRIVKSKSASEFTTITNRIAKSDALTLEQKGMMLHLLSLPADWIIYKQNLYDQMKADKQGTIDRVFAELINLGYIISERVTDSKSRFIGWDYTIIDNPDSEIYRNRKSPKSEITDIGQNAPILNTNSIQKTNNILNTKTLSWFRAQLDEIYMGNVKIIHKGKDIEKAIEESYMHLASDQNRLHNADGADCKRLLNSWLSNAKGTKPKKQRMSDEEFLKGI